jgi:hypothetical protein
MFDRSKASQLFALTLILWSSQARAQEGTIYSLPNSSLYPGRFKETFSNQDKTAILTIFQKKYGQNPQVAFTQKINAYLNAHPEAMGNVRYLEAVSALNSRAASAINPAQFQWKGDLNQDNRLTVQDLVIWYSADSFFSTPGRYTIKSLVDDWQSWLSTQGEAPSNIEMEAFIREKRSEPGYYERHLGIQTQGEK